METHQPGQRKHPSFDFLTSQRADCNARKLSENPPLTHHNSKNCGLPYFQNCQDNCLKKIPCPIDFLSTCHHIIVKKTHQPIITVWHTQCSDWPNLSQLVESPSALQEKCMQQNSPVTNNMNEWTTTNPMLSSAKSQTREAQLEPWWEFACATVFLHIYIYIYKNTCASSVLLPFRQLHADFRGLIFPHHMDYYCRQLAKVHAAEITLWTNTMEWVNHHQ